jgi:hypothetical protein
MNITSSMFIATKRYVFSVLPASRWQGMVARRIDEWLSRSGTIASFRRQDAGSTLNTYCEFSPPAA